MRKPMKKKKPSDPEASNRRIVFLVNPKFQLSFFWYVALLCILLCVALYFSVQLFFQHSYAQAQSMSLGKDHLFFVLLANQMASLRLIFLSVALISLVVVFIGVLYLSHRVAGPMLRLRKSFEAMAKKGEFHEIHFRKHDYFSEVA